MNVTEEQQNALQNFQNQAAQIANKRVSEGTRKSYNSRLNNWKKWLKDYHAGQYLTDEGKTLVLPLPEDVMLGFMGYIAYKNPPPPGQANAAGNTTGNPASTTRNTVTTGDTTNTTGNTTGNNTEVPVPRVPLIPKSNSTIMGYYSALKFEYSERNIPWNGTTRITKFLDGFQNTVALAREVGTLPAYEGKAYLPIKGFSLLAKYALEKNGSDSVYAHLYMILCWNIVGRTNSIAHLNFANVTWDNDSLVITLPRQKSDPSGQRVKPKCIYANPFCPEICPVLALALYTFSFTCTISTVTETAYCLFEGSSPENAFTKWLHDNALKKMTPEDLGVPVEFIGTHSFRKGAATYISSFDVVSENSIDMRAGWTNGRIRSKYIFGTPGADQLIGRLVSGLNIRNCNEFLVLPPHFDDSGVQLFPEYVQAVANFSGYPLAFRKTLQYLIASLLIILIGFYKIFIQHILFSALQFGRMG